MISDMIKRLRKAADVLEELFESNPANNPKVVKAIHKKMDSVTKKGYNYKGKHWTQKPENKARLRKILIRAHKIRAMKSR